MNKLRSKSGETLIETMVSLIIIVLCIGVIATAGALCVKINKAAKLGRVNFNYDKENSTSQSINFEAQTMDATANSFSISDTPVYNDNGYLFYE